MPGLGGGADGEDEGAFGEILRVDGADGAASIADEAQADVGADRNAEVDFGLHLAVAEQVVPPRGEDGKQPGGGAEALRAGMKIAEALRGVGGDGGVETAPRQVEPAKRHSVAVQDVVGPGQLAHDLEIARVALVGGFEVLERILHISGLDAALGHDPGVDGLGGGGGARAQHLRDPQDGADAVGEIVVLAGKHAVEQRHGGEFLAAGVEQEAQLGGGEQIVGRVLGEDAKLGFSLGFAAHAQQEIAQFAAQFVIGRVEG